MQRFNYRYIEGGVKNLRIPELITKDFNGLPIVFREDGYINMTKAAKHFEKKLSNFWRSPDTRAYIEAMEAMPQFEGTELAVSRRGGINQGSWCHPKLAVFFARWLDVRFAVWCDLMIDNILKGNIQTTVVVPTQEAVDAKNPIAHSHKQSDC